jgi:hypothetical protein
MCFGLNVRGLKLIFHKIVPTENSIQSDEEIYGEKKIIALKSAAATLAFI